MSYRKKFGEEITVGLIMACLGGCVAWGALIYLVLKFV